MIPALFRGRTILVVDDNNGVRRALRELLVAMLADVHVAVDGLDALDALEQLEHRQPDLIFCDLNMPAMDGCEFAHHLRQDSWFRETPLIAVTGSQPHVMHMWRAGFTGHIRKPFTRDALTRIAHRLAARPTESPDNA
jgi:CheY-like chemotaxis protein